MSTISDFKKWDELLFSGKVLSEESLDKMLTVSLKESQTCLGFWKSTGFPPFEADFYYRPGGIHGANANWIHLENRDVMVILTNNNKENLFQLSIELFNYLNGSFD